MDDPKLTSKMAQMANELNIDSIFKWVSDIFYQNK